MSASYVEQLLDVANDIKAWEAAESSFTDKREWRQAKQHFESLEATFVKLRNEYVDALLGNEAERENVVASTQAEMEGIRATCDPSWYPAVDYTSEKLLPFLRKEAAKSPSYRKALKAAPFVLMALAALAYFGIRVYETNDISAPLESKAGLEQRAFAAKKAIRYDDWMDTRVRRGGWVKGLLLWPIEPTDEEITAAGDFVGLALEAQQFTVERFGCAPVAAGYGDKLSDAQIEFVGAVAEHILGEGVAWQEPPALTVLDAAASIGGCVVTR